MRMFSRALFTFALLGSLAFGSYAFGKYVLSARLFGPKGATLKKNIEVTSALPPTSAKTSVRPAAFPTTPPQKSVKNAPRVEVEILPAEGEGVTQNSSDLPPLDTLGRDRPASAPRDTPSSQPTPRATADFSIDPVGSIAPERSRRDASAADDSLSAPGERPRRRTRRRREVISAEPTEPRVTRRRRRRRTASTTRETASRQDIAATRDDAPRIENFNSESARPRRRRRERVRDTNPSAPARRFDDSPVPQPENDGGGDSPVPIPE